MQYQLSKSVNTIPNTVTVKGANCFQPNRYICLNKDGFASLYPTISKIEAKTDKGILFKSVGMQPQILTIKNHV